MLFFKSKWRRTYTAWAVAVVLLTLPVLTAVPVSARILSEEAQENVIRAAGLFLVIALVNRYGRGGSDQVRQPEEDPRPSPGNGEENGEDLPDWVTSEDRQLLAEIIHAEARGEPFEGKIAVGAVVLNRVESPLFPNTIRDVIYQPQQFEPVRRGLMGSTTPDSYRAADRALTGEDPSQGALYFYNAQTLRERGWQGQERLAWFQEWTEVTVVIGNHTFAE